MPRLTASTTRPILVTGATGKTGRRVVDRLRGGGFDVREASRSSATPLDWNQPATWRPALAGTSAAYIAFYPDVAMAGSAETIARFAAEAVGCGVERLVLLSGRGEEEAYRSEQVVRAAGADWTIVRASWFCQNFNENFMLEPLLSGVLELPVGDVLEPFVDADDIADVVAAALTRDGHAGQVYEVTGPRLLSFEEAVHEIARATGRPFAYREVDVDAYASALAEQELPADVIELMRYLFTNVLDGRNAVLADGVQRALGREPRDFAEFARRAAITGVWSANGLTEPVPAALT
jgi:uncharacterized protein YbjT (DUF2867 family)